MGETRIAWPAAAMLGVAALWGGSYVIVKDAIAAMPMDDFLAWRFVLAAVAVLLVRPRAVRELGRSGVTVGVLTGLALTGAYAMQTGGLLTTPASVSGFITGLLVVLTPIAAAVLLRERMPRSGRVATVLAPAGLALLSLRGLSMGVGEALTLGCAAALALHIVALARWRASAPNDPVSGSSAPSDVTSTPPDTRSAGTFTVRKPPGETASRIVPDARYCGPAITHSAIP